MSFRLEPGDLQVGLPVRFNIYDETGHLLLRRGNIVTDGHQLADLLARGRRPDPVASRPGVFTPNPVHASIARGKSVSIFELLHEAQARLEIVLAQPPEQGFADTIQSIARLIRRAYRLDRDAALAQVLLQHGPAYPIYHHVHAAIVSMAIVDQSSEVPGENALISMLSAALTMNVAMLRLQAALWHSAVPPTPAQRQEIAAHPEAGAKALRTCGVDDPMWLAVVLEHHEAIDGSGYPMHLKGEKISQAAQVVAIAEHYCAMVSGRAYREPMLAKRVLGEFFLSRVKLDHEIASHLIKAIGVYPSGSLVRLANQDIAVVTRQTAHAHQPMTRSIVGGSGHHLSPAPVRQTAQEKFAIVEALPISKISFPIEPGELWEPVFDPDA